MPPTRWRGGSGLPRRSSSTGGCPADFTPGFVLFFGSEDLVTCGCIGFIGARTCRLHFPQTTLLDMPSRVRLIAIDIDGTLLPTSSTTISQRNRRALCDAQAAGIHIAIATGRRHQYAEPVLEQVGLSRRTVMISSNGSVMRHFDGELIQQNLLAVDTARALCAALRPFGQTMVFTFDRYDRPSLVVESMTSLQRKIGVWVESNRPDMLEIAPLEHAFDQGEAPIQAMLCGDIAQIRAAQQALETTALAAGIAMHRTEYAERDLGILDLLPPNCSKGRALQDYARSLGLEAAEVMAIGDNFNDQAMLEFAGSAVVMANAGAEMRALAARHGWAIGLTNDEDGVAATLEPLIRSEKNDEKVTNFASEVVPAESGVPDR
jgi:Cof subfamily protein (haloacid dehalogenase superfamily)